GGGRLQEEGLWMRLAEEPLQRPGAALLDLVRYGGQGHDPADIGRVPLVGEAGHVVFDATVPIDQRGGTLQPDRPVWRYQPPTRRGRQSLGQEESEGRRRRRDNLAEHDNLLGPSRTASPRRRRPQKVPRCLSPPPLRPGFSLPLWGRVGVGVLPRLKL